MAERGFTLQTVRNEPEAVGPDDPRSPPPVHAYRWGSLLGLAFILTIALLGAVLDVTPDGDGVSFFGLRLPETCNYKLATGSRCPGCGMTRSVVHVTQGDLAAAARQHPAGLWFAGWLVVQGAMRIAFAWQAPRLYRYWLIDVGAFLLSYTGVIYLPLLLTGRLAA